MATGPFPCAAEVLFFYVYGVVGAKMEVRRSEAAEDADVG